MDAIICLTLNEMPNKSEGYYVQAATNNQLLFREQNLTHDSAKELLNKALFFYGSKEVMQPSPFKKFTSVRKLVTIKL